MAKHEHAPRARHALSSSAVNQADPMPGDSHKNQSGVYLFRSSDDLCDGWPYPRNQNYRLPESEWFLEVFDEFNNSTVWEDAIATDEAALAETIGEMKSEGVHAFIGPHSA